MLAIVCRDGTQLKLRRADCSEDQKSLDTLLVFNHVPIHTVITPFPVDIIYQGYNDSY